MNLYKNKELMRRHKQEAAQYSAEIARLTTQVELVKNLRARHVELSKGHCATLQAIKDEYKFRSLLSVAYCLGSVGWEPVKSHNIVYFAYLTRSKLEHEVQRGSISRAQANRMLKEWGFYPRLRQKPHPGDSK